jgi:hypothetical protein
MCSGRGESLTLAPISGYLKNINIGIKRERSTLSPAFKLFIRKHSSARNMKISANF